MSQSVNLRLLLADDDDNDTFLLERAFKRLGWRAPLAILRNGDQVIDYLMGRGDYEERITWPLPDLLLLDHWMPRLSGIDVLNWVRSEPRFSALPIVLLTGGLAPAQAAALADLQAAYCVKLPDFQEQVQILQQSVERALAFVRTPEQTLNPGTNALAPSSPSQVPKLGP